MLLTSFLDNFEKSAGCQSVRCFCGCALTRRMRSRWGSVLTDSNHGKKTNNRWCKLKNNSAFVLIQENELLLRCVYKLEKVFCKSHHEKLGSPHGKGKALNWDWIKGFFYEENVRLRSGIWGKIKFEVLQLTFRFMNYNLAKRFSIIFESHCAVSIKSKKY